MVRDSVDQRTVTYDAGTTRRQFVSAIGAAGVAGLAGCTTGDDGTREIDPEDLEYDGEDVTIEYSTAPLFGDISDTVMESLYDAGLHENIDVNFTTTVWGADDLQDRYNQILSAGRPTPDLMLTNFAYTPFFAPRGWLLDLSEALSDEKLQELDDEYSRTVVDSMRWDDGLYGIPQIMGVATIQYRKDLVEQAGYDPEGQNWATEPMSWERFAEVTRDTMDEHGTSHGFTTVMNQRNVSGYSGYEHVVTNGGNYFGDMANQNGPVGDRPVTIDDEPIVETLRQLRTFMYGSDDEHAVDGLTGDILPSESLGWDTTPSMQSFRAGDAVMHRNWAFSIAEFGAEDAYGEDFGVMPYPYGVAESEAQYGGTGGTNSMLGAWHLSVNPNTEKLAATIEVIKAMTTDDFYLDMFEHTGELPPKPGLLDSEQARNVPVMGRYVDTLRRQMEDTFVHPINQVWELEKDAIGAEFHACLNREQSPEEAVAAAQDQVEQIEDRQGSSSMLAAPRRSYGSLL